MRVLIIPDVHLKPWMFSRASELMDKNVADLVVCLMDIADDWRQQLNIDLYIQTYDAAIRFAKGYPDTLWCYGNHDLSYLWIKKETGYSPIAPWIVCNRLQTLKESLRDGEQMAYLHRIDNVLFSHGGVADTFVREYVPSRYYYDVNAVVETINGLGCEEMWQDLSPIWYRPQYFKDRMYMPRKLLQVVGHTPEREILKTNNIVFCDVFSTRRTGEPIGTQEFPVIDTKTWEVKGITAVFQENQHES